MQFELTSGVSYHSNSGAGSYSENSLMFHCACILVFKHQAMKTYRRVNVNLHPLLISHAPAILSSMEYPLDRL